jgi:hypothetical protein
LKSSLRVMNNGSQETTLGRQRKDVCRLLGR